jgi:transposase
MELMRAVQVDRHMKRDGRELDHRTLEEIRRMALQRVREGEPPSVVIASYGFCRTTIYKWLRAAKGRGKGLRALAARQASGRPRSLTRAQERQVFRWINGRDPRQYGLDFGLWTRRIVALLIEEKFQVRLGVSAVGELLAKLGITAQKPLTRAYERDPEAIERWKRERYPAIAKAAKRARAEIAFWDETGFRADVVQGKTWGVKGRTPVVVLPGKRQSISAASAVSAKGAFWFTTFSGAMRAPRFVELLKQLLRHRKKPLFLVLDSLPAHKAKVVEEFVESSGGRLRLFFLPGYAPELNPDELVWNHAKRTGRAKSPLRKGESLRQRVEADLTAIQRQPALLRSLFREPSVAYITD